MRRSAAVAAALLAGCSTQGPPSPTTIVASDGNVFVPTLRVVREEPQSERDPSDMGRGGAFEFNYFHGRGSDTQQVKASDQPIKLGGMNFSGPQQVQHDFTLNWYEVNARGRIASADPDRVFGLDFLIGGAFPRLGFRVSTANQRASETFGVFGVVVGAGLVLRLRPGTTAQGRYTTTGAWERPTTCRTRRAASYTSPRH